MRDLTRSRWVLALGFASAACGGKTNDAASGTGGSAGVGGAAGAGGVSGMGGSGVGGGGVGGSAGTPGACVLEASGELAPTVAPGATLSGPGIVATDSGFAIGYRDQSGATLRAVVLGVSDSGVASAPSAFDLGGCASAVVSDGVSLAYRNGQGMLASSVPDCGKGAGAVFIPFKDGAKTEQASAPKNGAFKQLATSVHSLAPAKAPGEYELIYSVTSDAPSVVERVVLQGPVFKTTVPIARPFGDAPRPWAMGVTSDEARAFLAPAPATGTFELVMDSNGSDLLDPAAALPLPAGDSADLVAVGPRVVTGVRSGGAMAVTVWSLATGGATTVASGSLPSGAATSSALAADEDRLVVAHGAPGQVALQLVSGLTGTPNFGAVTSGGFSVVSHKGLGIDGTQFAIAAARGKIAIVWLDSAGFDAGGWLIARCD